MNTFLNILPGFVTCHPGVERKILRAVPAILGIGSLIILLPSIMARMLTVYDYIQVSGATTKLIDILVIGVLVVYWLAILTIAIGALLVKVMKGPAYVADAYPMEDMELPQF